MPNTVNVDFVKYPFTLFSFAAGPITLFEYEKMIKLNRKRQKQTSLS